MGDEIPTVDIDEEQRPTIAFRPTSLRQKAEWERAAAESDEYANTSHLIRKAVKRELAHGPRKARESRQGAVGGQQLGEVTDGLEALQTRMGDLEQAVSGATRAMNAGGSLSEETVSAVYAAIPEGPARAVTAEGLSDGVEVTADKARLALEQLSESPAVKKREIEVIEEGEGTTTITTQTGDEIEIQDPGAAIRRGNPLFYKREGAT